MLIQSVIATSMLLAGLDLGSTPNNTTGVGGAGGTAGLDTGRLIAKPVGEVTRIKRGGYSLKEVLKWETGLYEEIRVSQTKTGQVLTFSLIVLPQEAIQRLAESHLSLQHRLHKQNKEALSVVYRKVCLYLIFPPTNAESGSGYRLKNTSLS